MAIKSIEDLLAFADADCVPILMQTFDLKKCLKEETLLHPEYINRPIVSVGGGITSTLLVPLYCIAQNINPYILLDKVN